MKPREAAKETKMRRNAIEALAASGHDMGDMEIESTDTHVVMRVRCGDDVMELDMTPEQAADQAAALMFAIVRIVESSEKAVDMFSAKFQQRMAEMLHGAAKGKA